MFNNNLVMLDIWLLDFGNCLFQNLTNPLCVGDLYAHLQWQATFASYCKSHKDLMQIFYGRL